MVLQVRVITVADFSISYDWSINWIFCDNAKGKARCSSPGWVLGTDHLVASQ